jgi:hypothetical protein
MQNQLPIGSLALIGAFFLTVIVFGLLFLFSGREDPAALVPVVAHSTGTGGYGANLPELEGQAAVLTRSGRATYVRDFLSDPSVELVEPSTNTYLLAEEYGVNGRIYQIFHVKNGGFTLSLQDPNLAYARSRAEEKLLEMIPGTQLELCSYMIRVNTPR